MRALAQKQQPAHKAGSADHARPGPQSAAPATMTGRERYTCPCGGGCPNCLNDRAARGKAFPIQKKSLEISSPADADEKEADEVARKVVDGQPAEIRETGAAVNRSGEGPAEAAPEFRSALENSRGGGRALDEPTRSEMETKMGADLSGVRIHTGGAAHQMNEDVSAKAFTHGQDIFFRQGEFNPASRPGKELLAHELAHTVQQNKSSSKKINRKKIKIDFSNLVIKFHPIDFSELFNKWLKNREKKFIRMLPKKIRDLMNKLSIFELEGEMTLEPKIVVNPARKITEDENQKMLSGPALSFEAELGKNLFKASVAAGEAKLLDLNNFKINIDAFKIEQEGLETTATISEFESSLFYNINKANLGTQPEGIAKALRKMNVARLVFLQAETALYNLIESGAVSFNNELKFAISLKLKPSKYLKTLEEKTLKSQARKKLLGNQKALNKQESVLKKTQANTNEVLPDKNTPPDAGKKIKGLPDTGSTDKDELRKIQKAAHAESKAAKKIENEIKGLDKEINKLKKDAGKFRKLTQKFEESYEKRARALEKLSDRLSKKASAKLKKQAVKWIGKAATRGLIRVVTGILHVIPVVGQIMAVVDLIVLAWDIGTLIYDLGPDFFLQAPGKIWDWVKDTTGKVSDWIKKAIDKPWDAIKDIAEETWNWIKNAVSKAWEEIKKFAEETWNAIKSMARNIWDLFTDKEKDDAGEDGSIFNPPGTGGEQETEEKPGGKELGGGKDVTDKDSIPGKGHGDSEKGLPPVKGDQNNLPSETITNTDKKAVKTVSAEKVPYQNPSLNAVPLNLISYQAVGFKEEKEKTYVTFTLVINHRNDKGEQEQIIAKEPSRFKLVSSSNDAFDPKDPTIKKQVITINGRKYVTVESFSLLSEDKTRIIFIR